MDVCMEKVSTKGAWIFDSMSEYVGENILREKNLIIF